ncbi:MAG: hypothetical protein K8J08_13980, partial [Thermoanaerobaculia bacterium]|nr:hypothetical protein [Thermoanaerobaculia bacterium]
MPSRRALLLLGMATLLVAAAVTEPFLGWIGLGLDLAVVVGILIDLRFARRTALEGHRRLPPLLAQGEV